MYYPIVKRVKGKLRKFRSRAIEKLMEFLKKGE